MDTIKLPCGCDLLGAYGCEECHHIPFQIAISVFRWYHDDIYETNKYQTRPVPNFKEWCLEQIYEGDIYED